MNSPPHPQISHIETTTNSVDNPLAGLDVETVEELQQLSRLGRKYMWAEPNVMSWLQSTGLNIEPARFYSQLPTVDDIESNFEHDERFAPDGPYRNLFDAEHLREELAHFHRHSEGFEPPLTGARTGEFSFDNPAFSRTDAIAYWSAIRRYRPRRIVEIGAGHSSLIARDALAANGGGELILIEPYPMDWLAEQVPDAELIERPIQSFAADEFTSLLGEGDILFIDSTHAVKLGSDCLAIYLLLLPAIQVPVQVHVHDVYLPYGFPKKKSHLRQHWTEQHLLAAYLSDNPRASINFGSTVSERWFPEELKSMIAGRCAPGGGSIWFSLAPST